MLAPALFFKSEMRMKVCVWLEAAAEVNAFPVIGSQPHNWDLLHRCQQSRQPGGAVTGPGLPGRSAFSPQEMIVGSASEGGGGGGGGAPSVMR